MIDADFSRGNPIKISFGIIVLNGEPFTRYCLRQLYPFAHQIIVVEGACEGAKKNATDDGHSTDGTLSVLRQLKVEEDPEQKIIIVTAEDEGHPSGFWPGEKDEQSQAYAKRTNGDYLWQVDIDEFYQAEDVQKMIEILSLHRDVTAVSFKQIQFWGGFDAYADGWYLKRGGEVFHRIFRWGDGYRYLKHRPPTVVTDAGIDTRELNWVDAAATAAMGIYLYHYSLVFPKQVMEKSVYYGAAGWARRTGSEKWAEDNFMRLKNPFRVHNVFLFPSWLLRFDGEHPAQIDRLRQDIATHRVEIEFRRADDIERLLASRSYQLKVAFVSRLERVDRVFGRLRWWFDRWKRSAKDCVRAFCMRKL